jgi:hypothetical protein
VSFLEQKISGLGFPASSDFKQQQQQPPIPSVSERGEFL